MAETRTGVTNYTLHGRHIVHLTNGSNELHFFYEAAARPAVVVFNGTSCRYLYNLQGDVIGLLDGSNDQVVTYRYDAWGRQISCTGTLAATLGKLQPFRYRCYAYDEETKLYYVNSRYYDPEICRWICADWIDYLGSSRSFASFNLFPYCLNEPLSHYDPFGLWTAGVSFGGNANILLFGASLSGGFFIDGEGNVESQFTYEKPGVDETYAIGLADAGVGVIFQITDRNTVQELYGASTSYGGSYGAFPYGGADIITFSPPLDSKGDINGIQGIIGIGAGTDIHLVRSQTQKNTKENRQELLEKLSVIPKAVQDVIRNIVKRGVG